MSSSIRDKLLHIYNLLLDAYGPQYWWPGSTPLEVIVGAILTQNVAWPNAERAITGLKEANLLNLQRLADASIGEIAQKIRPARYYNAKSRTIKGFTQLVNVNYHGNLCDLFHLPAGLLRTQLLSVKGIGNETADSIILYAAEKPAFVVDTYTHRILLRLGVLKSPASYKYIRTLLMDNLPSSISLFNEYHALFVCHGRTRCKKTKPHCAQCPLSRECSFTAN